MPSDERDRRAALRGRKARYQKATQRRAALLVALVSTTLPCAPASSAGRACASALPALAGWGGFVAAPVEIGETAG